MTDQETREQILARLRRQVPSQKEYLTYFGVEVREFLSRMVDQYTVKELPGDQPLSLRIIVTTPIVLPKEARDHLLELEREYVPVSIRAEWSFVESKE